MNIHDKISAITTDARRKLEAAGLVHPDCIYIYEDAIRDAIRQARAIEVVPTFTNPDPMASEAEIQTYEDLYMRIQGCAAEIENLASEFVHPGDGPTPRKAIIEAIAAASTLLYKLGAVSGATRQALMDANTALTPSKLTLMDDPGKTK